MAKSSSRFHCQPDNPRTTLPTSYSLIVSKVNENPLPRTYAIHHQAYHPAYPNNYDGSTLAWAPQEFS